MAKKTVTYHVVRDFKDLKDKNKIYRSGDSFPNPANKKVSEERLNELMSKKNRLGVQLIRKSETEDKE